MSGLHRACWLIGLCAACASQAPPSPFFGDEAYLRFGVDPRDEAQKIIEQHSAADQPLALRIEGQHFTALGFMDRSGRATSVRAVTERGTQLALDRDVMSALSVGVRYALLAPPIDGTQDADGDGFEEFFVEQRSTSGNCILVYRVRDVGFIDPVPVRAKFFGRLHCPNGVVDVDGDGRAELVVDLALDGFEGEAPRVRAVLWAIDHRFDAQGYPAELGRYIGGERALRAAELADARHRGDFKVVYRTAIELAALTYLLSTPAADQVATFDNAIAGFAASPVQASSLQNARQRISTVWNAAALEPLAPAETRPTPAELVHPAGP